MSEPDVRQVLVHPVVWPHLELWLAGRGLVLARVPVEDDLPTYAMTLADPGEVAGIQLTAAERQFLTFALDLAADHMANRGNEFDEDDEAALARLRRMADEAGQ